jgi:hypothetical protein
MKPCAAITRDGTRCKRQAIEGYEHCYSHRPDLAEERKANARAGGRAGGRGRAAPLDDATEARSYTKGLISRLLKGDLSRDVAAVAFQGINTLMRVLEQERRIRDSDELEARIAALERRQRVEQNTWRAGHRR